MLEPKEITCSVRRARAKRALELIEQGRMQPAALAQVEAAKIHE